MTAESAREYDSEEIKLINKSRERSDAVFTMGGGGEVETKYGHRYQLTYEQIETIRYATENLKPQDIDRVLGLMSLGQAQLMMDRSGSESDPVAETDSGSNSHGLYDTSRTVVVPVSSGIEAPESPELSERRRQNRLALNNKIEAITDLYASAFDDKMLPPEVAKWRWFNKAVETDIITGPYVTETKRLGLLNVLCKSRARYHHSGDTPDELVEFETEIKRSEDTYRGPRIQIRYDNGGMSRIKLSQVDPHQSDDMAMFKDEAGELTPLMSFIRRVSPLNRNGARRVELTLTGDTPAITVADRSPAVVISAQCEYTFNSKANLFLLAGSEHMDDGRTRPRAITVDNAMLILDDILRATPARKVSY